MPKPEDLAPLDFIKWASGTPKAVLATVDNFSKEQGAGKKVWNRVRHSVGRSRAVSFDYEASKLLGELSADIDLLNYLGQSAAAPWPDMLVHVDPRGWVAGVGKGKAPEPDTHGHAWLVQSSADGPQRATASLLIPMYPEAENPTARYGVFIEPLAYDLDFSGHFPGRNFSGAASLRQAGVEYLGTRASAIGLSPAALDSVIQGRDVTDLLLMGVLFADPEADWNLVDEYAKHAAPVWSPLLDETPENLKHFLSFHKSMYAEIIGAARQIMTVLTVLGLQRQYPALISVEGSRRNPDLVKGQRCSYLRTSAITINIGALKQVRAHRSRAEAAKRRRGLVRGHWAHYRRTGDVLCEHVWKEDREPDPAGRVLETRQRCRRCGMKRTWKKAHERGDASIGYVTHPAVLVRG